jgi:hypothetical protein
MFRLRPGVDAIKVRSRPWVPLDITIPSTTKPIASGHKSQEELDANTDGLTGRQLGYTVTWTGM